MGWKLRNCSAYNLIEVIRLSGFIQSNELVISFHVCAPSSLFRERNTCRYGVFVQGELGQRPMRTGQSINSFLFHPFLLCCSSFLFVAVLTDSLMWHVRFYCIRDYMASQGTDHNVVWRLMEMLHNLVLRSQSQRPFQTQHWMFLLLIDAA